MSVTINPRARILITRADRIGDLVISTPVFKAVREAYPQAWIAALTFVENREILQGNPFLNEVILYDKKGAEQGFFGQLKFARQIAKKHFDIVIHLHATNRMHWMTYFAGIPIRIGWNRKAGNLLTHALPDIKREGKKHEAEYNFELLRFINVNPPNNLEAFFPLNERSKSSLDQLLWRLEIPKDGKWIVLSPGASCPSKQWPAARFAEVANRIKAKYPDHIFAIIGSSHESVKAREIQARCQFLIHDLTGRLTLGMLGWVLKRSSLLISNDSGPVHIASALGTPVVSIFGRKQGGLSPTRWKPLGEKVRIAWKDVGCSTCLAHNCEIQFLCLDVVTPQNVMVEVNELLVKA